MFLKDDNMTQTIALQINNQFAGPLKKRLSAYFKRSG